MGGSTPTKLLPVRQEGSNVSGFHSLSCLLTRHVEVPEIYFLLIALVMGQPVKLLPAEPKVSYFIKIKNENDFLVVGYGQRLEFYVWT